MVLSFACSLLRVGDSVSDGLGAVDVAGPSNSKPPQLAGTLLDEALLRRSEILSGSSRLDSIQYTFFWL
jgi:hypothetical protein